MPKLKQNSGLLNRFPGWHYLCHSLLSCRSVSRCIGTKRKAFSVRCSLRIKGPKARVLQVGTYCSLGEDPRDRGEKVPVPSSGRPRRSSLDFSYTGSSDSWPLLPQEDGAPGNLQMGNPMPRHPPKPWLWGNPGPGYQKFPLPLPKSLASTSWLSEVPPRHPTLTIS